MIAPAAPQDLACLAGAGCPEGLFAGSADAALDLLRVGGLFLGGVAASALHASESIASVPLPAAGWLLLAGIGGLGLFRRLRLPTLRRTRDGFEPVATSLRGGAWADTPAPLRAPALHSAPALHRRLLALARRAGEVLRAFAPGRTSPVRPCGGAGTRWAATAERAPPVTAMGRAAGVIPRVPRHADGRHGWNKLCAPLHDRLSGLSARFHHACRPVSGARVLSLTPVPVRRADSNKNGSNPHPIPRSLRLAEPQPGPWFTTRTVF